MAHQTCHGPLAGGLGDDTAGRPATGHGSAS